MIITMYSNFMNHHQKPFCDAMYQLLGENFHFVASTPVPAERIEMGYEDYNTQNIPYLLLSYNSENDRRVAEELAVKSDAVIWGSAPRLFFQKRTSLDKLTFVYSERIWKKGIKEVTNIKKIAAYIYLHTSIKRKNSYLLCASAYTAKDFRLINAYVDKALKWGYFPVVERLDLKRVLELKHSASILWTGRFIELKHPEIAINAVKRLIESGYDVKMDMIGDGVLLSKMKDLVNHYNLREKIRFHGSISHEKVRDYMINSQIFLFTSDMSEGWGAVLNEAMNSACVVIASDAIGSVPFLVDDGVNGLTYHNMDEDELFRKIVMVLNNEINNEKISESAYQTMLNEWNAEVAAQRIVSISEGLIAGKNLADISFESGPCSKA